MIWRRIVSALVVLVLLASAYFGFAAGPNILRAARSPLQWIATATELLYAASACVALWLMYRRDSRQRAVLVTFAVAVTVATGLAPVVWGHGRWTTGFISAAVACVIVGGLIAVRQALAARAGIQETNRPN